MKSQQEIMIKIALDTWNVYIQRVDKLIGELTDEQLLLDVATNRNSGVYLLGHITSVHDRMLPLMGLGTQLYPQLEETFVKNPDKSGHAFPSTQELRTYWKVVNETLGQHFNSLTLDEWFQKHTAVSDQDFSKEPNRNKLNILINRTNHLSGHYGQMVFLKK